MKNSKNIPIRIIVSPLVLLICLIASLRDAIRQFILFLRYGGEWINYSKKVNPDTIQDLVNEIQKLKS